MAETEYDYLEGVNEGAARIIDLMVIPRYDDQASVDYVLAQLASPLAQAIQKNVLNPSETFFHDIINPILIDLGSLLSIDVLKMRELAAIEIADEEPFRIAVSLLCGGSEGLRPIDATILKYLPLLLKKAAKKAKIGPSEIAYINDRLSGNASLADNMPNVDRLKSLAVIYGSKGKNLIMHELLTAFTGFIQSIEVEIDSEKINKAYSDAMTGLLEEFRNSIMPRAGRFRGKEAATFGEVDLSLLKHNPGLVEALTIFVMDYLRWRVESELEMESKIFFNKFLEENKDSLPEELNKALKIIRERARRKLETTL